MALGAWVAVCLCAGLYSLKRPAFAIYVAVSLWILIPTIASYRVSGVGAPGSESLPPLHPSSMLVLTALALRVASRPQELAAAVRAKPLPHVLLLAALVLVFAVNLTQGVLSGTALVLNQLVAPGALFLLVVHAAWVDPGFALRLHRWLVTLAALCSGLAFLVWNGTVTQPFQIDFERYPWYAGEFRERQMATLDHPLALGLFLAVCVPLTSSLRRQWVRIPALALIATGVLLSQSRAAFIAYCLGCLYLLIFSKLSSGTKLALAVAAVVGAAVFSRSSLFASLATRFLVDEGSAAARSAARDAFQAEVGSYVVVGGGTGASYEFARSAGLVTSLENGWLMYVIDYGVLAVVLLLAGLVAAVFSSAGKLRSSASWSLLLAVGLVASYSSIATDTSAGPLLFLLAALAQASSTAPRPGYDRDTRRLATAASSRATVATSRGLTR